MTPLSYRRALDVSDATRTAPATGRAGPATRAAWQFIAGGTNILDYMKLSCWTAEGLLDINDLRDACGQIQATPDGVLLGALVRMSAAAAHPIIQRDFPVIREALLLSATGQIRNMASLAGNVLQRTRCSYFRDIAFPACNKRSPGSGCAAMDGNNRIHAVLGTSASCISTYPGDLAQAFIALDTQVDITGASGTRRIAFGDLHCDASRPEWETVLEQGDLITGFFVPAGPHTSRSTYVKVRDRQSYAYGLATAAVALHLAPGDVVQDARIGLGGVAYKPWRATAAEAWLKGRRLTEQAAEEAGRLAFVGAVTRGDNAYKPDLGARTVARALLEAAGRDG